MTWGSRLPGVRRPPPRGSRAPATSWGSTSDGMVASSSGWSLIRPYLLASKACSRASMPGAKTRRPRRSCAASSPALEKRGKPASARLTFATRPGVRMLSARQRSVGPSVTGSTRLVSSARGSIAATTVRASISSPPASTTPEARSSRSAMRVTSASQRISPPAALTAPTSAAVSAPGPPRANTVWPAAPPSLPAESARRTPVVPADHGPIAVYSTPRAAIAARR